VELLASNDVVKLPQCRLSGAHRRQIAKIIPPAVSSSEVFMIETMMFFACGFLTATLLAMVLLPVVHHRAVRLTRHELQSIMPPSLIEIQAEADSLRADFAISTCRLERSVEQLRAKASTQISEIARKTEMINRLREELERRTSVAEELVNKVESLTGKIAQLECERERTAMEIVSLEAALSAKEMDMARPPTERTPVIGDVANADLKNAHAKREQLLSLCDDEMNTLVPKLADISKEHAVLPHNGHDALQARLRPERWIRDWKGH
jgi:hypothetical protein